MISPLPYNVLFCTILWVDWAVLLHMVLTGALFHLEDPKWPQSQGWKLVLSLAGSSTGEVSQGLSFSFTSILLSGCLDFLTEYSNVQRQRVPHAWKWKLLTLHSISSVCLIGFVIGPVQCKKKRNGLYHERVTKNLQTSVINRSLSFDHKLFIFLTYAKCTKFLQTPEKSRSIILSGSNSGFKFLPSQSDEEAFLGEAALVQTFELKNKFSIPHPLKIQWEVKGEIIAVYIPL